MLFEIQNMVINNAKDVKMWCFEQDVYILSFI